MSHYFSFASFLDSELLPSKVTFLLHVGKRGQHERCEYQHVYFFAPDCRPPPHRFCRLGAKFAKLALRHLINPDGRKSLWPRSFRINFGALRASSLTQNFHAFFCSLFESFVPSLAHCVIQCYGAASTCIFPRLLYVIFDLAHPSSAFQAWLPTRWIC